ncbi:MAG: glutamate-5-semialdehyde dehydrogenase [Candidatus Latescibacterota bacterium]|nr:MAG: glutamate-5-semialdehyde dehydrogenase [Candidatus Latescibacterota bacterium]
MDIREYVHQKARAAKEASRKMAFASTQLKNDALLRMAEKVEGRMEELREANRKDLQAGREKGLSSAMLDRLELTEKRIRAMAQGLREVAALPDPVGMIERMVRRPNGLLIGKMRVPLGVVGIIYESRPNVTVDAASLCLKSGNAVVLRGGSEAINSNVALASFFREAIQEAGLPEDALQMIEITDRRAVTEMLKCEGLIDLIVPRGGKGLIRTVVEESLIPVIKHYEGICHVYVHEDADLDMAETIAFNAKVQRPGVCNAMETLLVHRAIAGSFLPKIGERLREAGVEIRGCPLTREILSWAKEATEEDWRTEYLDLILSVRVVEDLDQAIEHINTYGSAHTDAIVTKSYDAAQKFVREVDSSSVMVNASTRFSDGGEYGLGAEIGISTDKLHARGPMGLEELTTYKWVVYGDGQIRT